jgi:thioredoxin 1
MKSWFTKKPAGLAAVILVCAGGLLAYSHVTSDGLLASTPKRDVKTHSRGDKRMNTVTQNTVIHADEKTFRKEVLKSDVPVLVDFYADWCGPCRALGPVLEELADETPNAKIVKINVDNSPQLAGKYGVSSIPNLLVFRDGKVTDQQVGLASKEQLKTLLSDRQ